MDVDIIVKYEPTYFMIIIPEFNFRRIERQAYDFTRAVAVEYTNELLMYLQKASTEFKLERIDSGGITFKIRCPKRIAEVVMYLLKLREVAPMGAIKLISSLAYGKVSEDEIYSKYKDVDVIIDIMNDVEERVQELNRECKNCFKRYGYLPPPSAREDFRKLISRMVLKHGINEEVVKRIREMVERFIDGLKILYGFDDTVKFTTIRERNKWLDTLDDVSTLIYIPNVKALIVTERPLHFSIFALGNVAKLCITISDVAKTGKTRYRLKTIGILSKYMLHNSNLISKVFDVIKEYPKVNIESLNIVREVLKDVGCMLSQALL